MGCLGEGEDSPGGRTMSGAGYLLGRRRTSRLRQAMSGAGWVFVGLTAYLRVEQECEPGTAVRRRVSD